MTSKLAIALALAIHGGEDTDGNLRERQRIALAIDSRLAEIRTHYEPEELARCPIVTHHGPSPCAFCITAAMREFILTTVP